MSTDTEAGARLKRFVLERIAALDLGSLSELSRQSGVGYDTLHAWFRGRAPTAGPGGRVAATLGVTYSELLEAFEGRTRPGGRYITDPELRALIEAAAEAAVLRVLRSRGE